MRVLKQSTAITVLFGPYIDRIDGFTEETGLAGAGTEISKAGGAFAAGPTLGTHDSDGWYPISLTTTHTNTLGDITIKGHDNGTHLPVWMHFTVLPANSYDALVNGSGVGMRSDVQGWLGTTPATPTVAGVPEVDVTHFNGVAGTFSGGRPEVNTSHAAGTAWGSGAITAASIATGAIDADALATDAVTEIQSGLSTLTEAGVRSAVGLATANLDTQLDALPTTAEVNAEVDTALADVGLTLTVTGRVDAAVSTRLASAGYTAPDNASVTAIKAKTDSLTFTVAGQVDSNIRSVNDVTIVGNGVGTPFNV